VTPAPQIPPPARGRQSPRGSVLVLTLWTLLFLSALALAVGAHVSAGIRLTAELQDRTVAAAAARRAVSAALDLLAADTNTWESMDEAWAGGTDWPAEGWTGESAGVGRVQGVRPAVDGGEPVTVNGLVDEESRVSLNRADEALLVALLQVAGKLSRQDAETLGRRTVEWRTPPDEASGSAPGRPGTRPDAPGAGPSAGGLTGRAGAAYDPASGTPYAGGAPFACIEEWRLVRGVDEQLYAACAPYVSVLGNGKVNINTAPRAVLAALGRRWGGEPAVAASLADAILRHRAAAGVFPSASATDLARALAETVELSSAEATLLRMMARSVQCRSAFYGGVAQGRVRPDGPVRYRTAFVVSKEKGQWVDGYDD
jgi:type II secretory pathway component PulK